MKSKFPYVIAVIMIAATISALVLGALTNVGLQGRPDQALLKVIGQTAALGINCSQPGQSPIFLKSNAVLLDSEKINYALLDENDAVIANRWTDTAKPSDLEFFRKHKSHSLLYDLVKGAPVSWVSLTGVCGRPWQLLVYDAHALVYGKLLLLRQTVLFAVSIFVLCLSVFGITFFLETKGRDARIVMAKLRGGDLKARLSMSHLGRHMEIVVEFNHMIDALEELVLKIRQSEQERLDWLKDLAHDLRTPLASMSAAAETFFDFDAELQGEQRQKLMQAIMDDIQYFQILLNDVFFLATLQSSEQSLQVEQIDLRAFIEKFLPNWSTQATSLGKTLSWACPELSDFTIEADPHLLRRLFQNIIDNALRYSLTKIELELVLLDDTLILNTSNDTQALDDEEVQNWGKKRLQRRLVENSSEAHTSLGLGSSIIRTIIERHRGHLSFSQKRSGDQAEICLQIKIPRNSRHSESMATQIIQSSTSKPIENKQD